MTFVPYPEEEAQKSKLLLQAALFRAQGQEEQAAELFAQSCGFGRKTCPSRGD